MIVVYALHNITNLCLGKSNYSNKSKSSIYLVLNNVLIKNETHGI